MNMKSITYKDKVYHFRYREDVLKHYHWFCSGDGKWICRIIRERN